MAAIVSNNFRSLNAKGFIEDVRSEQSNIYVGVGKTTAWQDSTPDLQDFTDGQAPLPVDTIDDVNEARANMIGIKLLKNSEVSHVVPRYDWTAGTVYSPWDSDDPNIYENSENPFYVLTKDFKVYKCIDRISSTAVASDVPTKVQAAPFETADGYKWKYMYTIIATDSEKFLTRSYMPVKTLTIETEAKCAAGQSQFAAGAEQTIQLANENPKITIGQKVEMANPDQGTFTGTIVVTGISGKFVTVSASTSTYTVDDNTLLTFGDFEDTNPLYDQQQAQKDSLSLAGAIDRIEIIDTGSGYNEVDTDLIANQINIVGDGSGAQVDGAANVLTDNNTIIRLKPSTGGVGYSVAQVSIIDSNLNGSAFKARAVIAPPSGHGVDPVAELGGFYVGVNTQISGVDDTDIANNQDFRQITILKNPTVNSKIETKAAAQARGSNRGTFRATKFLTYDISAVGSSVITMSNLVQNGNDVLLKGSADTASSQGVIPRAYVTNVDLTDDGRGDGNGRIYYVQNSLTGYNSFPATDSITYSNSAAPTATVSGITLNGAGGTDYNKQSGEILFIENRDPIQRSSTQIEDIKLILEF
jgi:hypothetical protein